ncbi:inducible alternative oxidase 2 [Coemansia sp. RSA 1199]|nr:inducible alternative oxidase 2 [Coemansia sp. RSA 1199]
MVKSTRKFTNIFFRNKYIHRSVMLKVVAAVPEMAGGLIRHIKSLQGMRHDGGWIGHLLHEAENERMHLMTWMEVSKPVLWERALIATVQTGFFEVFSLLYMVIPRTAHRVVGYLEEEAVTLYTHWRFVLMRHFIVTLTTISVTASVQNVRALWAKHVDLGIGGGSGDSNDGEESSTSSSSSYSSGSTQLPDKFAETKALAAHYLKDNINGLQTIAEHSNQSTQQFVTRQAESIAEFIDELVQCAKSGLGKAELENKLKRTIAAQLKCRSLTEQHSGKADAEMYTSAVRFLPWLCPGSDSTFSTTNEKHIYPCFVELINFVAELVVRPPLDQQPTSFDEYPKQLVRSYNKTDVKPDNAEGGHRVDMALKCDALNYNNTSDDDGYNKDSFQLSKDDLKAKDGRNGERPNYSRIFAVIEVKPNSSDANMLKGFSQLVEYSKNLYWNQHNRRFIWGLVSGGSNVKACVLGPNFLLASRFMDVTTAEGQLELIGFLVNWSFCELSKLGYDPTVRFNLKHSCFTIDMADSSKPGPMQTTYYLRKIVVVAERVFGRHTRCFVVGKQPLSSDGDFDKSADILIKDAWPEVSDSTEDDMHDESKLLEQVSKGLAGRSEFEGLYPKFLGGGRMQIQNSRGEGAEDTTQTVLGETVWAQLEELPLRAHMRIAMSGVGKPLKTVRPIPELIIVIYDVMRCHMGIIEHCQILHRDISEANILVRRDSTSVHGMLIDFDHAISITDNGYAKHAERTGTVPFMSVNNLENLQPKRTALDDWESIIYILCGLGTFGWNSDTRPAGSISNWKIASWDGNNAMKIAEAKRDHMDSSRTFTGITKGFNPNIPDIRRLAKVVEGLREVLIDNHKDSTLRGAMIIPDSIPEENESDNAFGEHEYKMCPDPFVERAAHWETISESLLAKLEIYAQGAKKLLTDI